MSKINSPSSNNSGTSSETSETQSVEDNNPSGSGTATPPTVNSNSSRIPTSWKRMKDSTIDKDAEAKRPPWRAVSVSTLPKPDKNALLRAKLLDASRRLRAGKSSVAIQTDIVPTKLMKEVNLGTQPDLILYKEIGILTDGFYSRKKEDSDEFVLTYSVSQLTDPIPVANVATQTLLPKVSGDDFMQAYFNSDSAAAAAASHFQDFTKTEQKLLEQIRKIRDGKHTQSRSQEINGGGGSSEDEVMVVGGGGKGETNDNSVQSDATHSETDTDATSATVKSSRGNAPPLREREAAAVAAFYNASSAPSPVAAAAAARTSSLLTPTFSSWHFEYDEVGDSESRHFLPYTINPRSSSDDDRRSSRSGTWQSFLPFVMHRADGGRMQRLDWNAFLYAVDELINESNRLADIIENITARKSERQQKYYQQQQQQQQRQISALALDAGQFGPVFKPLRLELPSDYWLPIIEQQEKELSELQRNLK